MGAGSEAESGWLERFHAGEKAVLERCYREHFAAVDGAVGQVLRGADKETTVHDVFLQLIERPEVRRGFHGGNFRGWLVTVSHNLAIDHWRRRRRERAWDEASLENAAAEASQEASQEATRSVERGAEARLFAERYLRERLPAAWLPVFELRFLSGLDQRSAAGRLGISRTTLAYRELRIRRLLRRYLRERSTT